MSHEQLTLHSPHVTVSSPSGVWISSAPPHRSHFMELTCWQTLHFFLYSPGMLARKAKQNTVEELELEFALHRVPYTVPLEPDDHYPLTCTPENGVWMLGNLNTCRFLPLPGSEAKSLNLMMFYEGKKSMSMISWSRKGTQAN